MGFNFEFRANFIWLNLKFVQLIFNKKLFDNERKDIHILKFSKQKYLYMVIEKRKY